MLAKLQLKVVKQMFKLVKQCKTEAKAKMDAKFETDANISKV